MTETELKAELTQATTPRLGRFGEKIYKHFMIGEGFQLEGLHKEKADFIVEGIGRVDVKTKGFGKRTAKTRNRISNTNYCFVSLHDTHIELEHEDEFANEIRKPDRISWSVALDFWSSDEYRIISAKSDLKDAIKDYTQALKYWIEKNWQLKSAVVYREGRSTQESMTSGDNPWGPVTFYESPSAKRKIDIKVLVYFDRLDVWNVMAYPLALRDEIEWTISRTNEKITSFNPHAIDRKFVFENVDHFKCEFINRFEKDLRD